jgi:hypothetical protein
MLNDEEWPEGEEALEAWISTSPAPEGDVIVKQFMLLEPVHVEDTLPTTRALLREQLATLEGDEGVAVLQHLATPPTRTGRLFR